MRVPRAFLDASHKINRIEDEAARELLALLKEARIDLYHRLLLVSGDGRHVLQAMLQAVDEATARLNSQMALSLYSNTDKAIAAGAALADTTLPNLGVVFHLNADLLQALQTYQFTLIQDATDAMKARVRKAVQLGVLAGKPTVQIAKEMGLSGVKRIGAFKIAGNASEAIARTEIQRVANVAAHARYQQASTYVPGLKKTWVSAHDARVRPAHAAADGQTVGMDEMFDVGGEQGQYPLAPTFSAENSVLCRCRMIAQVPES